MPFTDPMADGPAIQAAGLRALKAGMTLTQDARAGARLPRERRRHADHPDGLLQPDLRLRRRRVPRATPTAAGVDGLIVVDLPPEEDDELLPARARAPGIDFIRLATPTTDDDAPADGAAATPRASSTTSRSPASPAPRRPTPKCVAARSTAHQAPHRPAGRGRLRHQDAGAGRAPSPRIADGVGGRLGAGRARSPHSLDESRQGRRQDRSTAVHGAGRATLADGVRAHAARSIDEVRHELDHRTSSGPKIRCVLGAASARRRRTSGSSAPTPAQMIFHRDLEANQLRHARTRGHHMRMAAEAPPRRRCSTTAAYETIALPDGAGRSAEVPRREALRRPPEGGPQPRPARRTPCSVGARQDRRRCPW